MWERHPEGHRSPILCAAPEGELEGEPPSELNDSRRSSTRDVTVERGVRQGRCWCVQADQVEHVRHIGAEDKSHRLMDTEVTFQSQVDVAVSRRTKEVARRVAVRSSKSDAT